MRIWQHDDTNLDPRPGDYFLSQDGYRLYLRGDDEGWDLVVFTPAEIEQYLATLPKSPSPDHYGDF